jgi:hypothetical protein
MVTILPDDIPSPNFICGYKKGAGGTLPSFLKMAPDGSLITDTSPVVSRRIAYHASGQPEYIGEAIAGGTTASSIWRIKKMIFDGSDRVTAVQWADGNAEFDNEWDNYASLTYS